MDELFPSIIFGPCRLCGGGEEATTNADAEVRDASEQWFILTWYAPLQLYLCDICLGNQQNDEISIHDAEQHLLEDEFRSKAGFTQSNADTGSEIK